MKYVKIPKRAWRGVVLCLMLFLGIGAASPAAAKTITVNLKNFPDKAMREALDVKLGDKMTQADINNVSRIEIESSKRKINLKGIEYFPKLNQLVMEEKAKTRTLPEIPKLEVLGYYNNAIGELKLPYYPKLESLGVHGRNIKQLDLLKNKQVQYLSLSTPKLENLDLSPLSQLESLELEDMDLTGLDLSNNLELQNLTLTSTCGEFPDLSVLSKLKSLSLKKQYMMGGLVMSGDSSIENLTLEGCNRIRTIHIADCPKLKQLTIKDAWSLQEIRIEGCGKLNRLKVKECPDLKSIAVVEGCGKLDRLEVKKCPVLESVSVDEKSQMTRLVMEKCEKMTDAGMEQMNLSKLSELCIVETGVANLSAKRFPKLKSLQFYENAQKKIDFRSLKNLQILRGGYEKTTNVLDVSMLPKLRHLSWPYGALKSVRFGKESRFTKIDLSYNQLSGEWNMQKFKKLNKFNISYNKITSLDFGKRERDMEEIYCRHNKLKKIRVEEMINLPVLDCRDNPGVKVYMNSSDDECMDWRFGKKAKVYYKYG